MGFPKQTVEVIPLLFEKTSSKSRGFTASPPLSPVNTSHFKASPSSKNSFGAQDQTRVRQSEVLT